MNQHDHDAAHRAEETMLRAEIHRFEIHLAGIVNNDDCAYDKARIRAFETLLQEHRRRFAALLILQPYQPPDPPVFPCTARVDRLY